MLTSVYAQLRAWARPAAMTAVWLWFTLSTLGQRARPDVTVGDALRSLAARADVVFVGRVTAIRREAVIAGSAGSVAIDFRVEQTLAGNVGGTYTLHEWGGLWPAGQGRYWPGERVAIFLHAPGKAGLSSPVDGMEGVLPVVQQDAKSEPLADVGRLATRLLRPNNEPLAASGRGVRLSELAEFVVHSAGEREPVLYTLPAGATAPPPGSKRPAGWFPVSPVLTDRPTVGASGAPAAHTDPPRLHALLLPVDPERRAVGESLWSSQ